MRRSDRTSESRRRFLQAMGGIASVFQKGRDYLINGYRDHGHSLALGMEPRAAMAEMFPGLPQRSAPAP